MVHLIPMTETEFQDFRREDIPHYAAEQVKAGNWDEAEALGKAEEEYGNLLPQGVLTEDHLLFTIVDEITGTKVGMLWFAVNGRAPRKTAFLFNFVIDEPYRRKGYGTQAMLALERKAKEIGIRKISFHVFAHNLPAQALYRKVGYEVKGLYMGKDVK